MIKKFAALSLKPRPPDFGARMPVQCDIRDSSLHKEIVARYSEILMYFGIFHSAGYEEFYLLRYNAV
jgi:hypothetical protein